MDDGREDGTGEDIQEGLEAAEQAVELVSEVAHLAEGGDASAALGATGDAAELGAHATGAAGSPEARAAIEGARSAARSVAAADAIGAAGSALSTGGLVASAAGEHGAQQAMGIAGQALSLLGGVVRTVEQLDHLARTGHAEGAAGSDDAARHVELSFHCPSADETRWLVRTAAITEALCEPYLARIELVAEDLDAWPRELLGKSARLTLTRVELTRHFCGIVRRVEHGRTTDRFLTATIELVPAIDALRHRRDSRIFQHMTVPAIVHDVLGNALDAYDNREVDDSNLHRTYPEREYCVQYDETDFQFVHRLLEEEGIAYHFAQDAEHCREKLVLTDSNEGFLEVETFGGETVIPYVADRNQIHGAEPVHELLGGAQLTTTSLVAADFDWTDPDITRFPIVEEQRGDYERTIDHEVYDHTTGFTHSEYSSSAYQQHDAVAQARMRHELTVRDMQTARGAGVVIGFAPATFFTLRQHPNPDLDGKYLITRVQHRASSATLRDVLGAALSSDGHDLEYQSTFECIPADMPYRPDRKTPKPRAHGVLSAAVVGPGNDGEIHSDDYGRVKVQFHWDRLGLRNKDSSCFLRVMQAWAGAGRGIQTFPRIGDEVVVDFLGGDIDRPIVVGSLYSAANPPPYRKIAEFTKTTIKSKTVPADGEKHNEICLDDAQGHELVLIHASRDLTETVDHCHSTHVRVDQSNTVGGDQTETVNGTQTLTVDEDRESMVKGNETLTVKLDQTLTVHGTRNENIAADRNVYVKKIDTETFQGGRDTTVCEYDNLHVEAANRNITIDQQLNVNAGAHIAMAVGSTSKLYMKGEVYAEGADRVAAKSGDSQLLLNPQKAELASATEVRLVCGAASIVLKPGGEVEIVAPAGIKLQAASNSIEITPSGVTTNGVAITANAVGVHTILGAIVRIN